MRTVVVGIDPGVTTGFAVAVDDRPNNVGEVIMGPAAFDNVPFLIEMLDHALTTLHVAVVYIEDGPALQSNAKNAVKKVEAEVCHKCDEYEVQMVWVTPSVWKPHPRSKDLDKFAENAVLKTPHGTDAVRICSYALWKEAK